MGNEDELKKVTDLLQIWYYIKSNNHVWPEATDALEKHINFLAPDPYKEARSEQVQATR